MGWFFEDDKPARALYLPEDVLFETLGDARVLDKVADEFRLLGSQSNFKRLNEEGQINAIWQKAKAFSESEATPWYANSELEIIAGCLWRSGAAQTAKRRAWSWLRREENLRLPIATHFLNQGFRVWQEVPTGNKRVDLLAWKKGGLLTPEQIVAIELKNSQNDLKRGLDQMTTYSMFAHKVYLACTPWLAAEYVDKYARSRSVRHWDAEVLNNKLKSLRFGFLTLEGERVGELIDPQPHEIENSRRYELFEQLDRAQEITRL